VRTPACRPYQGLLRSPAGEQRRQFAGARRPGSRRHIDVSGIQVPHAGGEVIEVAVGANAHPVRAPLGVDAEVIARARPMPSRGPRHLRPPTACAHTAIAVARHALRAPPPPSRSPARRHRRASCAPPTGRPAGAPVGRLLGTPAGRRLVTVLVARGGVRGLSPASAARPPLRTSPQMTRFGTPWRVPTYGSDGTRTRGLRRDRPWR
jgi:hypothetical protein